MEKRALITGITGQDGSYLAEFLLTKGYKVFGMVRRNSTQNTERINHLLSKIVLIEGDLGDMGSMIRVLQLSKPDEVYNLAAQSFVKASWQEPTATGNITGLGVTRFLDAIRIVNPKIKFYQASSSEMFGKVVEIPQTEKTPFYPRSPYGIAKAYAHYTTINYRESYGMYACCGILFNHESPRRGMEFVTRKISYGIAAIKLGLQDHIYLGNIKSKRDWGFAGDYVRAMWLMLQQKEPDDYVIGSGETHPVEEFLKIGFDYVGIKDWKKYVKIDPKLFRPADVDILLADPSKARAKLGWKLDVSFQQLVEMMVEADLKRLSNDKEIVDIRSYDSV